MRKSSEADQVYLRHIRDAARRILEYAEPGEAHFLEDQKTQDAIARNFEIIGEAAKRLTDDTRMASPDLPWKDVAGFRDFLIHGYDRVTPAVVWNVVEHRLPQFMAGIEKLVR